MKQQITKKVFKIYEEQVEEITKLPPRIQLMIELSLVALEYQTPKPSFSKPQELDKNN